MEGRRESIDAPAGPSISPHVDAPVSGGVEAARPALGRSSSTVKKEGHTVGTGAAGAGTLGATAEQNLSNLKWQRLQNLKSLLNEGFITVTEYKERKDQLIDEMTGTTCGDTTKSTASSRSGLGSSIGTGYASRSRSKRTHEAAHEYMNAVALVPKPPPSFMGVPSEHATRFIYNLKERAWNEHPVLVKLDPEPFAKGGLRLVYHLQFCGAGETAMEVNESTIIADGGLFLNPGMGRAAVTYVAKMSMDRRDQEDSSIYFRDVEMQTVAKHYARLFNEYKPPKPVDFVKAWILRLDDREGRPICGVERFIDGSYRKHNNNFGFVSEEERNTPQAFSHFTYHSSAGSLLVCDIQGVSDMYTDPQVHSVDGSSFGKGNLQQRGIDKFIQTHRCNAICRYLKLPAINANYAAAHTQPMTQVMKYEHVQVVKISNFPLRKEDVPSTTPLITSHSHHGAHLPSHHAHAHSDPPPPQKEGNCCCAIL